MKSDLQAVHNALRVGELLTEARIFSQAVLESRLAISKTIGQPLGQTLIQMEDLTQYQLLSIIQIQSLLNDGILTRQQALYGVKLICGAKMTLEDALTEAGYMDQGRLTTKLGELLVAAGLINQSELETALDASICLCLPLGQMLIHEGKASPEVVAKALSLQRQLRTGALSRKQAVCELKKFQGLK